MTQHQSRDSEDSPVIETASATTSPDNANSGGKAYVITAIALVVLFVLALAGGGCMALIYSSISEEYANENHYGSGNGYNNTNSPYDYRYDDLDDLLEDYNVYINNNGSGSSSGTSTSDSSTARNVSVDEALDFDLAPYNASIKNEVSASAYAGTPSEVRDFVQSVISTDGDYHQQVAQCLNTAAIDESARSEQIKKAIDLCAEAQEKISAIALPELKDDKEGAVKKLLDSAIAEAKDSWSLTAEEIGMLDTDGEVQTRKLWNLDDDVLDAVRSSADILEEALQEASSL